MNLDCDPSYLLEPCQHCRRHTSSNLCPVLVEKERALMRAGLEAICARAHNRKWDEEPDVGFGDIGQQAEALLKALGD